MKRVRIILLLLVFFTSWFMGCQKSQDNNPNVGLSDYVVFAWNDLGMHCLNPDYSDAVILPPFNTVMAQVVKRGDPPALVTSGIKIEYSILNNTTSYSKRSYGGFWDHAVQLFGNLFGISSLQHDVGLTGNGLSGQMVPDGDHYVVTGMPVTPVKDDNTWDPYQVAEILVKDLQGNLLVKTRATVPVSDEINCAKCHGANAFQDILTKHDDSHGTNLMGSRPVLCATCHGSPALGTSGAGSSGKYLSQAIHGFHSTKGASCYDCHPGQNTKCSRSTAHTATDGNCTTCHGSMAEVASSIGSGRTPWGSEPACVTCHTGVAGVNTGSTLYRNSQGHGNMYCSACHGSPHAMIPSEQAADNYQALQYQGFNAKVKTIGSCGMCHSDSRGESNLGEFLEVHGGLHPEQVNGCHVCHTSLSASTSDWPHAHQWTNSNK
jgi:hypothetical protein